MLWGRHFEVMQTCHFSLRCCPLAGEPVGSACSRYSGLTYWNSVRKVCPFFPIFHLFNHLISMDSWIFLSFTGSNTVIILLLKLFQLWPLGALSGRLLCPWDMPTGLSFSSSSFSPFSFFPFTRPSFLALWAVLGSSCIFLGALAPFTAEWCLETKIQAPDVVVASRVQSRF